MCMAVILTDAFTNVSNAMKKQSLASTATITNATTTAVWIASGAAEHGLQDKASESDAW